FLKESQVGAVGVKMLGKKKEYRQSAGYFPSPKRLVKLSNLYKNDEGFKDGTMKENEFNVDWVEGSFLLTRRLFWDKVGGLDEDLFMYGEDLDFCKKLKTRFNLKTIYFPCIQYVHYGGYGAARYPMIINGFRRYIEKYETNRQKVFCSIALNINIILSGIKLFFIENKGSLKQLRERMSLLNF
ncbi:glycosyltransferase family 2 protein, partial [Xanthovirga aplysinae]|uniref:glycosyltransferase family 2 protein n=1 Tax=Xanthovirga aplysinae TaxID=2529853 RepID=UPI003CCD7090